MSCFEGGTELIPQIDTGGGGKGQAHVRGGPIRGQVGSKEELRGLSVG